MGHPQVGQRVGGVGKDCPQIGQVVMMGFSVSEGESVGMIPKVQYQTAAESQRYK